MINKSLIVSWSPDVGEVAWRVTGYLRENFPMQEIDEIETLGFFSLSGVEIENNIIHFPQAKLYSLEEKGLIILQSNQPSSKRYKFLSRVFDIAEKYGTQDVYTIGGIVSMIAHTDERKIMAVVNSAQWKEDLAGYDLDMSVDYQGSASMSGFLLWVARQRNIPAVSLWVNVPFYLAEKTDYKASRTVIDFLNQKFDLGVNLKGLDREIEVQEEQISWLRKINQDVDNYITRLERKAGLTQQEMGKLLKGINNIMS